MSSSWPLLALVAVPLLLSSGWLPFLAVAGGLLGLGLVAVGLLGIADARRLDRAEPPELASGQLEVPVRYRGTRRRPRQPRARRKPHSRRWVPVGVTALVEQARRETQPVVRKLAGWRRPADKEGSQR